MKRSISPTSIPPLIRKNTLFLAVCQALSASGMQLIPSLGGLVMLRFTSALSLVGLTLSIGTVTGSLMSYPAGRIADAWGRRPVLLLGFILGGLGSLLIYFSIQTNFFWIFVLGLGVYGLGLGALGQTTVTALDMYPPSQKAEGVSYVLTGTSMGSVGAPALVWATTTYAASRNLDTLAVPWLAPPVLLLLCSLLVLSIRPDPLDIARNLHEYYPREAASEKGRTGSYQVQKGIISLLGYYPRVIGVIIISIAYGVMIMIMALTSVIMRQHGYSLTMISIAIALHVFGMFGFSIIFGKLTDRYGRKRMFYTGGIILALGGFVTPLTNDYWTITIALFLVGVGWSALNVSTTAIMGDTTPPTSMGSLMGITLLFTGALNLSLPAAGGILAQNLGFRAVGVAACIITAPILVLTYKLRETTPGNYEHQ